MKFDITKAEAVYTGGSQWVFFGDVTVNNGCDRHFLTNDEGCTTILVKSASNLDESLTSKWQEINGIMDLYGDGLKIFLTAFVDFMYYGDGFTNGGFSHDDIMRYERKWILDPNILEIERALVKLDEQTYISVNNDFCAKTGYEGKIFPLNEETFEEQTKHLSRFELVKRLASSFDPHRKLFTLGEIIISSDFAVRGEEQLRCMAKWMFDTKESLGCEEIRRILFDREEPLKAIKNYLLSVSDAKFIELNNAYAEGEDGLIYPLTVENLSEVTERYSASEFIHSLSPSFSMSDKFFSYEHQSGFTSYNEIDRKDTVEEMAEFILQSGEDFGNETLDNILSEYNEHIMKGASK